MVTSASERVRCALDEGALLHPLEGNGNTVDLAQAAAFLAGAPITLEERAEALSREIGAADHYVFVLVDGLGMHLVEQLAATAWLRAHVARELRAVFPSSTAPALTSIATAAWPAEHAVLGWWLYLPDAGVTSTILPFVERFGNKPLDRRGVRPSYAFPHVARPTQFRYDVRTFAPSAIAGSTFSRYASGDAPYSGYGDLHESIEQIARRVRDASTQTYSYWYIPHVDTAQHSYGVGSAQAWSALHTAQTCLAELASHIGGRARIIVTADHGQIDVAQKHILAKEDELPSMMAIPPTGDPRSPLIHVRPEAREPFVEAFEGAFEAFALVPVEDAVEMRLFGPMAPSEETRSRAGDFVAVPLDEGAIFYEPDEHLRAIVGVHGGLSADEMRIPLILA